MPNGDFSEINRETALGLGRIVSYDNIAIVLATLIIVFLICLVIFLIRTLVKDRREVMAQMLSSQAATRDAMQNVAVSMTALTERLRHE